MNQDNTMYMLSFLGRYVLQICVTCNLQVALTSLQIIVKSAMNTNWRIKCNLQAQHRCSFILVYLFSERAKRAKLTLSRVQLRFQI